MECEPYSFKGKGGRVGLKEGTLEGVESFIFGVHESGTSYVNKNLEKEE